MNKRNILKQLILACAALLVFSACGAEEQPPTPTVVISGPQVQPTEPAPPTPTLRTELTTATAPPEDEPQTVEAPEVETAPPEPAAIPTEAAAETPEQPTAEATSTETPEPTASAPADAAINGMPASEFIVMSPQVRENVRAIFAQGQAIGRNADVFSILGDSLIATPQSLAKWDEADYVLGDYAYLQPTIDKFQGSFGRYGPSVRVGLHSWSVFDPLWADKDFCNANEDVLACELRLNNPSVMLVFLGSNDSAPQGGFKQNYRQVVESLMANGVVPILATKADRFEGPDNANNTAIREVADELNAPLLEFDLLANTLPGRGLSSDSVHLTYLEPLDYSSPGLTAVGYPTHNLAVLMILDEVRREVGAEQ